MIAIVIPWQEGSEFATVSVSRVISAAITKVKTMGIVTEGKAVVLHDSVRSPYNQSNLMPGPADDSWAAVLCLLQDITDGAEFEDWVMRLVDVGSEKLAPGWTTPLANSTTIS